MRKLLSLVCLIFLILTTIVHTTPANAINLQSEISSETIFRVNPARFTTPGKVNALIPLNDGRMLVAGKFTTIGNQSTPRRLAVLKSDGSVDGSFQADAAIQVVELQAAAIQGDGKILIGGFINNPYLSFLVRLNANGSLDNTFIPSSVNGQVFSILTDGDKILIGGNFTMPTAHIARLNQNGTVDSTFNGVSSGASDIVYGIARQSSGKYIIVGDFVTYNGINQSGLARLNVNGALDESFLPGGYRASKRVAVLNDNSVVVGGEDICNLSNPNSFAWYTPEGSPKSVDSSPDPDLFDSISAILPLSDGGFLIGGWNTSLCSQSNPEFQEGQVWRYGADGTYRTMVSFGSETDINALAIDNNGKVLVGGQGLPDEVNQVGLFDGLALLDLSYNSLEKVPEFQPVVGDEAEIYDISTYSDGRLLVAGDFSHVNGSPRFGLARLLTNGTLDTTFKPFETMPGGWSNAALALPDGRVVAGFGHENLYLIGSTGSLTDLSSIINYDRVSTLALQSDGKVLVGTDFGTGVKRLKADFSGLDDAFNSGDAYGSVYALAVQGNNKILVAGDFSKYNNVDVPGLVRLDTNGSIDDTFTPPVFMLDEYNTATIYSIVPLLNSNILVGGDFTMVDSEAHEAIVRLGSDGVLDTSFSSPDGVNTTKTICVQGDGQIWVGGIDSSFFRNPLVLNLSESGVINPSFTDVYQDAHGVWGKVNKILCSNNEINWVGGKFSLINNGSYNSLVRYFPLGGQVFLPFIKR